MSKPVDVKRVAGFISDWVWDRLRSDEYEELQLENIHFDGEGVLRFEFKHPNIPDFSVTIEEIPGTAVVSKYTHDLYEGYLAWFAEEYPADPVLQPATFEFWRDWNQAMDLQNDPIKVGEAALHFHRAHA